jgi:hypothetical protein
MPKAAKKNSTLRRTASLRKTSPAGAPRQIADPIFAAIENHHKLNKALHALWEVMDMAECEAAKKHGRRPSPLIDWRNYSGLGHSGIERAKDDLRLSGVDPETIKTEYWDARARLLGAELARKEWDKRVGLAALRRDVDRATSAEQRAAQEMARTKPRTPAGAGALLAYTKTLMFEVGEMDWHKTALDTMAEALAAMGKASPRVQSTSRSTCSGIPDYVE